MWRPARPAIWPSSPAVSSRCTWPSNLRSAGEGHVIDVEVEAHADGVGGDQEIDVARLVERHLGVARARAERTEHDGRTAALAADQLGDGIDLATPRRRPAPCAAAAA